MILVNSLLNAIMKIFTLTRDFGKLSVECNYEDFHTYTYEGQFWLAGKRDSKWRWVNWFNGYEASQKFDYHQELYILENWSPGR